MALRQVNWRSESIVVCTGFNNFLRGCNATFALSRERCYRSAMHGDGGRYEIVYFATFVCPRCYAKTDLPTTCGVDPLDLPSFSAFVAKQRNPPQRLSAPTQV